MASYDEGVTNALPTRASSLATQTMAPNGANTMEVVVKSFEGFLSFVIGLSIFGASTFAVIVSEIANPSDLAENPRFTRETVRILLGISWLLFILALGIVALAMSLLAFQREHPTAGFNSPWRRTWERLGLLASSSIQLFVIVGFLFLSLVLVAYTEAVGWVAVAFTSTAATFTFVSLAVQWV
jgi:hypothetical protein